MMVVGSNPAWNRALSSYNSLLTISFPTCLLNNAECLKSGPSKRCISTNDVKVFKIGLLTMLPRAKQLNWLRIDQRLIPE